MTAHDGERYVAHVLPLRPLTRQDAAIAAKAVAALFVTRVGLDSQASGGLIARTFELTPTELRVLLAIIDVGGVPQTAENLGRGRNDGKNPFAPGICENRRHSPGGPRQDRSRLFNATGELIQGSTRLLD